MSEEIEKILSQGKSRKRPIDAVDISGVTPEIRRVRVRQNSPLWTPSRSTAPINPLHFKTPSRHFTVIDTPPSSQSMSPIASPLPRRPHRISPSTPCQPRHKRSAPIVIDLVDELPVGEESNPMISYDEIPSSAHSRWPLKYVVSMAEGFGRMDTMSGSLEHRFFVSFPSAGRIFPKTAYNTHSRIWKAATQDQKESFIAARYTTEGHWKAFTKEVKSSCEGKVPGKRRAVVKKEIIVKKEVIEIIDIDSD